MKAVPLIILIMLCMIFLSGCTEYASDSSSIKDIDNDGYDDDVDAFPNDPSEWKDSDNDGMGDNSDAFPYDSSEIKDSDNDGVGDNSDDFPNNSNEQYDSDKDGVGNNADAFPYDSTQSLDRDGDSYGDNPNGNDADRFPDDHYEWKDTDNDGIGDNADIFDTGNAGIKVYITKYQGDYYGDEWGATDPYFKIWIHQWNTITKEYDDVDFKQSKVFENTNLVNYPLSLTADVNDDVKYIRVTIQGWDDDFWSNDEQIDVNGESSSKVLYTRFVPQQTSYEEYTADGRLDLLDEMDGYIEYYIQIVEV